MKDTDNVRGLTEIAELVFTFAKVNRVTLFPDGTTPESDTDHTVMLSISACVLAERFYKDTLDIGKVAQFAIVHDIVEAYVGDTDTFGISPEEKLKKDHREKEALELMRITFIDIYPWLPLTTESYERLDTSEARFVKVVDKIMSKLSHLVNNGALFKQRGTTKNEVVENYSILLSNIRNTYGKEFPELLSLMEDLLAAVIEKTYSK